MAQIFGRAGRPQYDTSGEGILITHMKQLPRYLALVLRQLPIESQFIEALADHLNAEVALGTVSNMDEAVTWLSYTYLHVRMLRNPLVYGITQSELAADPALARKRAELIAAAAATLDNARMLKYQASTGLLWATDLGRTASHYYIQHETITTFTEELDKFGESMLDEHLLNLICKASEFSNINLRDDEMVKS